jgi:hypothetical protein
MGRYQNHRLYPVGPKVRRIKIVPDGRIALGAPWWPWAVEKLVVCGLLDAKGVY